MATTETAWRQSDSWQAESNGQDQRWATPQIQQALKSWDHGNISGGERIVSVAAGSILALLGTGRRDLTGLLIAGVGGGLILRGATGHCPLYESLGLNTNDVHGRLEHAKDKGLHVSQSFMINKSPEELYAYWHNFENLPRIMSHLKSVQVTGDGRSRWIAEAPSIAGGQVEWDAETTADEPNSRIAWQSLEGADVNNRGSVSFERGPGDRGTAVRVEIDYLPPAGRVGKWLATLFGENPEMQVREDLRTFKRVMELGEAPTVDGQPHGTCLGHGIRSR